MYPLTESQRDNELILQSLADKCDGVYGTAAEAIDLLSVPEVKTFRPYTSYRGKLSLGDYNKYPESALYVDVIRYFKTHKMSPASASNFVIRSTNGAASGQSSNTLAGDAEMADAPPSGGDLAAVKNAREYQVNTTVEGSIQGKLTVERDELAKGYEYGRTAVHISESDENVTKLETLSEFTIIGFIPCDKVCLLRALDLDRCAHAIQYERYLNMGESCITIAEPMNDKARMALSSLIHSLYELESYAVARIVSKDGKDPQVLLLAPLIEPDIEGLIDVPLPFAEDVRGYRFPPLDRVITTSGATVTMHRNLPSDELVDAMSDYVDSMDLSRFGKDENG
jgi:ATP-dependent DNA helicase 2 subunit 2